VRLFLDTETTGLEEEDVVIEVGIITDGGEKILDSLVRPMKDVSEEAQEVHGIPPEELKEAPEFSEVKDELRTAIEEAEEIWAYNADFDRRMLRQTAEEEGDEDLAETVEEAEWKCLMERTQEALGRDGWVTQAEASREVGVEAEGSGRHRALFDAKEAWGIWVGLELL
jgi:DNA polymerase-3 subunit epsilon